jgi:CBS domain containing-hemolysin-like protein
VSVLWSSIAVLLLVLGNAYFVAAEYSLVTARRSRLSELAELGNRRARLAVRLLDDPVRFIATSQLGVTGFSILIGAVGEPIIAELFDPYLAAGVSFLIAILIVTYLHVVIGELVPKSLALATREKLVLHLVVPLEGFYIATKPIIWVMQSSADAIVRLFGVDPKDPAGSSHTEHEIRMLVAQAPEIEEAEQELIYKAFDFADKEVNEVMVPKPEVVAISVDMPPTILSLYSPKSRFSGTAICKLASSAFLISNGASLMYALVLSSKFEPFISIVEAFLPSSDR